MDKEDVLCMFNGILFSHEKEGNPAVIYGKWKTPDRERQILQGIISMQNLKTNKKKPPHSETESSKLVAGAEC